MTRQSERRIEKARGSRRYERASRGYAMADAGSGAAELARWKLGDRLASASRPQKAVDANSVQNWRELMLLFFLARSRRRRSGDLMQPDFRAWREHLRRPEWHLLGMAEVPPQGAAPNARGPYEETDAEIRALMSESDTGWPSTDEDAASLNCENPPPSSKIAPPRQNSP